MTGVFWWLLIDGFVVFFGEGTGVVSNEVVRCDFDQIEFLIYSFWVEWVIDAMAEGASCGWVDRGWDVTLEAYALVFDSWIGDGDG